MILYKLSAKIKFCESVQEELLGKWPDWEEGDLDKFDAYLTAARCLEATFLQIVEIGMREQQLADAYVGTF